MKGEIPLQGGWRVYSSGAGIATGLILRCLFGLYREKSCLVVDPVIPPSLDTLTVRMELMDRPFDITYRSKGKGCGTSKVTLNGHDLPFTRGVNPYRTGAARVPIADLQKLMIPGTNRLTVEVG